MADRKIKLAIPTGRMSKEVLNLLQEAGLRIPATGKNYRPPAADSRFEVKMLKAANIPKLVEYGAHDAGFSGLDWIEETQADVETILDTNLLPVRIVSAVPVGTNPFTNNEGRPIVVASEYERLTKAYMDSKNVDYRYLRTFGATEVFPPEDADMIVDNTATGSALAANNLEIAEILLPSTTRFLVNRQSLKDKFIRDVLDNIALLMKSILDARNRVLLEMNVEQSNLDSVINILPAMKSPTVQPLHGNSSFAVKAAVPRKDICQLVLQLRSAGATDILQTQLQRVII